MEDVVLAYKLHVLFDQKITSYYFSSFKGEFGKVQIDVLNHLYETPQTTAMQLSESLNVPKQHISKIVKKLEESGLLDSEPDAADKRARILKLSDKGRALVEEHIQASNEHYLEVTDSLSDTEKAELRRSMESIVHIMQQL